MCKLIGVEILAANALIDILESKKGRGVPISALYDYGIEVASFYEKVSKERAVVLYDGNRIGNLVVDYSDLFEIKNDILFVKKGVNSEMLRDRFRGPLTFEILISIMKSRRKILGLI